METIIINEKEYLLDAEKAIKQGLLKEKMEYPMSFDEYAESTSGIIGYGASIHYQDKYGNKYDAFKTLEEAKAFNALGKLIQLRDAWWGDWKPDFSDAEDKYIIVNFNGEIKTGIAWRFNYILMFPTEEMCNKFLDTFRDLLEQAKMFL